tara:strand:- start:495 stop:683 length:189 start_codon:yes stop_codon:yes gene_type:complete
MTVKDLITELSGYSDDTRLDFILLGEDWENSADDTALDIKGIVGSGETDVKYIEIGVSKNGH